MYLAYTILEKKRTRRKPGWDLEEKKKIGSCNTTERKCSQKHFRKRETQLRFLWFFDPWESGTRCVKTCRKAKRTFWPGQPTLGDLRGPFMLLLSIYYIYTSLLLSSLTRRRLYPQRSSGQAVVTGVTCLQFLSRIGSSIPTARRFSSNVANSRSRAFR